MESYHNILKELNIIQDITYFAWLLVGANIISLMKCYLRNYMFLLG